MEASVSSTDEILNWMEKEDMVRPRRHEKNPGYSWLRAGTAKAPMIGGCVPSVNHLLGTKYWIPPKGTIFFIDVPEGSSPFEGISIADLDAYLADLDNAGVFKEIVGLVIGSPYRYSPEQESELFELIRKYTENTDYPVLYNVNIGHKDPIITLPFGSTCLLDSERNLFRICSQ